MILEMVSHTSLEPTPGKCLIGANAWQGAGLFLYEESSDTVTKILNINDYGWNHYQSLPDGDFLIANSNTSSTAGILYYNASDDSAIKLFDEGSSWEEFFRVT